MTRGDRASERRFDLTCVCVLGSVDARELEKAQFVLEQCAPKDIKFDRSEETTRERAHSPHPPECLRSAHLSACRFPPPVSLAATHARFEPLISPTGTT